MTDPLERISPTRETGKKNAADSRLKHEKHPHHVDETETDSVDISEEAREKAAGKKRKNILDYLNEAPE
jgi:hypothetical protein